MKVDEELVMALPCKLVEATILGLYDPVNQHLVKLAGFDFGSASRQHFRRELRTWFRKIQRPRTPEELVEWLRCFHQELAERLHHGEDVLDMIPE